MHQNDSYSHNYSQVEQTKNREELIDVFKEDDHAAFLLYESGSFKKSVQSLDFGDKDTIIQELKEGILYSCWPAVMQLKQGLCNLDVLTIIKNNKDMMKQFFCYQPPVLSPGKFRYLTVIYVQQLFTSWNNLFVQLSSKPCSSHNFRSHAITIPERRKRQRTFFSLSFSKNVELKVVL